MVVQCTKPTIYTYKVNISVFLLAYHIDAVAFCSVDIKYCKKLKFFFCFLSSTNFYDYPTLQYYAFALWYYKLGS